MTSFDYTIKDENGIHARPAGELVKLVKAHGSKVVVKFGDKQAEMKKLLALMGLGIKQGDTITVEVEGDDEAAAAKEIEDFLKANL
ncbi:MAG: HPr family phosphocarrier protein [Catonella sp.]|jgi:phosphocarrier protein|nr:HPr family phosphocarrier protein [Catonella sp.]MDY6355886.1 HPr family phosphocarrier protein [Catonella sp.]